ncbi:MAG: PEP-CTERM sorting domain-containing protein [Leptolyngbya sp. PLA3]|nr:MAG: PEP-CTERM sorting domain-containing protein [Cyanobacteria bacterium CYA]MCE7969142.1 PEP-CTERM sorting domain-containing protein [Leptolyngbya sp. PL-A3]
MHSPWIAVGMAVAAAPAFGTVINFDELASGTIVTNQYAEATFSSSTGFSNTAIAFSGWGNILCTPGCIEDTYVDFTNPVNNLMFWAIEANFAGHTADFNVYENGVFAGTVALVSAGGGGNHQLVDLSSFSNVTRLEIVNILDDVIQENGIGWDAFSFDVVPAPGTLMLAGVGLIGIRRRR